MTIGNEEFPNAERNSGDHPLKPKHKHPTFIQNLREYFTEYCNNTGIHGFKYIGEYERTIFERWDTNGAIQKIWNIGEEKLATATIYFFEV